MEQLDRKPILLPRPKGLGGPTLMSLLMAPRDINPALAQAVDISHIATLLWAAQASTGKRCDRYSDHCHPIEIHLCAGAVEALPPGGYRYDPDLHALHRSVPGDVLQRLSQGSTSQNSMTEAPAMIVITAMEDEPDAKDRSQRIAAMEAGHVAQNILLMAQGLNLSAMTSSLFDDQHLRALLSMLPTEYPYSIVSIGMTD